MEEGDAHSNHAPTEATKVVSLFLSLRLFRPPTFEMDS